MMQLTLILDRAAKFYSQSVKDKRGPSLCDHLASFLKERPGVWIDGRDLAQVAGAYGWRTRVSELRRAPYNLTIENRQRKDGAYTVSEYRLCPPNESTEAA